MVTVGSEPPSPTKSIAQLLVDPEIACADIAHADPSRLEANVGALMQIEGATEQCDSSGAHAHNT